MFGHSDKTTQKSNLKEKSFILAQSIKNLEHITVENGWWSTSSRWKEVECEKKDLKTRYQGPMYLEE